MITSPPARETAVISNTAASSLRGKFILGLQL